MKLKFTQLIFLILFLVLKGYSQSFDLDSSGNPEINQEFVNHNLLAETFETIDGKQLNIQDFNGKIVIIDFWQTWCRPCLAGFKGFQRAKEKWPNKIEIIAASPEWADSKGKIKRFIRKNNYNFQFIWAGELEKKLTLKSIPYKIILGPDGSLLYSISDSEGSEQEFKAIEKLIRKYF